MRVSAWRAALRGLYGCSVMARFSRWSSLHGLKVLIAVFAVGAVIDAILGHRTAAIISAALAVAVYMRDRARQSG